MFGKKGESTQNILDHAYEIVNEEDINLYAIVKVEDTLSRVLDGHLYWSVRGEYTIYRLQSRGYLSMEQVYQKYGVSEIPVINSLDPPQKGIMKRIFKQK